MYYPFFKIYEKQLVEEERANAKAEADREVTASA
jgi:cellobiose-specific phosphotransferase system component IIC